jgi:hypothetical protein
MFEEFEGSPRIGFIGLGNGLWEIRKKLLHTRLILSQFNLVTLLRSN